jgi:nucleoside-diphosphate-sugar epimerase
MNGKMMGSTDNQLFCFGMGYCARAFAAGLPADRWTVAGTRRSLPAITDDAHLHVFDGSRPMADAKSVLATVTHVLVSAAPDDSGDPTLAWHGADLCQMPALQWLGYLSTTGVYGNTDGAVVDETAPLRPSSRRSENRVLAERQWLALYEDHGLPVHIFRLPGIYGPGRSALDQVAAGKIRRIDKPGHQFSRIHVDDIAATLAASAARPRPGRIYNVCDNEAAAPADVTAFACKLLGVAVPDPVPFEIARLQMSPMALSFWQDDRRVDNRRITSELDVSLRYPTYREGLKAIYDGMES